MRCWSSCTVLIRPTRTSERNWAYLRSRSVTVLDFSKLEQESLLDGGMRQGLAMKNSLFRLMSVAAISSCTLVTCAVAWHVLQGAYSDPGFQLKAVQQSLQGISQSPNSLVM